MSTADDSNDLILIEEHSDDREEMFEQWFTDRRTSIPVAYRQSAPPVGDDDVDAWLR